MNSKDFGGLFLLAALWGASFIFMRIAAPEMGPFMVIELRVLIAGLALLLFSRLRNHSFDFKKRWKKYLLLGAVNSAIPFTLIATATLTLSASLASILNSTTPLFGAIVAAIWIKEELGMKKVVGLILGIGGVVVLLGWSPTPFSPEMIIASSLSVLAAVCYGIGGVYSKKYFEGVDSLSMATGQQLGAAIVLLPFAVFNIPKGSISALSIISVITLAVLCTSFAYIIYFKLMESVGPTKTLTVTFLVPVFGMIWGAIFLQEVITTNMIVGLGIILGSIFITSDVKLNFWKRVSTNPKG